MARGPAWPEEEMRLLCENMHLPEKVLAEKLGRSKSAVQTMKHRVRHNTVSTPMRARYDGDERPSGWYEETIGALLMEDPDAFTAWRHYHRYVELEYAGEAKGRITHWVTLRCRRDANAP